MHKGTPPESIHKYKVITHVIYDNSYSCQISRLLKITGLFCRLSSLLYGSFAKETYNFKEPTNGSHPIIHTVVSGCVLFALCCSHSNFHAWRIRQQEVSMYILCMHRFWWRVFWHDAYIIYVQQIFLIFFFLYCSRSNFHVWYSRQHEVTVTR